MKIPLFASSSSAESVGELAPGQQIDQLQLHFTIDRSVKNSWSVGVLSVFLLLIATKHHFIKNALIWITLIIIFYSLRVYFLWPGTKLENIKKNPILWRNRLFWLTFFPAATVAAGPVFIFPSISDSAQQQLTLVICCWLSGSMAVLGAEPRVYKMYASLFAGGLAIGWIFTENEFRLESAILLILYAIVMIGFSKNFSILIGEGIRIRDINARLVQELSIARDAAEEANLAKSRFLALASHDLRQPLHALTLLNGVLKRAQSIERTQEISLQMSSSLDSLARLFESILDLSKLDAAELTPDLHWVSLNTLLRRVCDDCGAAAHAKQLQLQWHAPPIELHTDPELFERLVRNLVDNAIKFTNHGTVQVEATSAAGMCVLSVADTGVGIPRHLRDLVFKEYYQINSENRRGDGLGLGLAIVRKLAHLLGIAVSIHENQPHGTRFELQISLPNWQVAQTCVESFPMAHQEPISLSGMTVLCIDDDVASLNATQALLREWQCIPLTADSPESAQRIAQRHPHIDVVLSDYALGASMHGEQLIHALRKHLGEVPGALLTGDAMAALEHQAGRIEFPVLTKPVQATELRRLLEVFKEMK
jgi:signal transduction histidine kinase/CheY-like chemotaxis protein